MLRTDLLRWVTLIWLGLALNTGRLPAAVGVGDLFPALADAGLSGELPATRGRVQLVDFWASWCAPCKASFPFYGQLQRDLRDRGLVVVAISVDQDESAYRAFLRRMNPAFAVVRDARQELVAAVAVPAMPTCFIVGRDGRVRAVHRGFRGAETESELRATLERVLAEAP